MSSKGYFLKEACNMDGGSLPLGWYAVYTKPGHEEAVAVNLERAGIGALNPKVKKVRFVKNKYRETVGPFFPCYIFARFDAGKKLRLVKYTRGVKGIVGSALSPWPVAEEIISAIEERIGDGGTIELGPALEPGERVRIADGPFRGLSGVFERGLPESERVMVLLNEIGYQAKVEMERRYLRSVEA